MQSDDSLTSSTSSTSSSHVSGRKRALINLQFKITFLKQEQVHWTSTFGAVIVGIGVCVSALRRWLRSNPGQYEHLWFILNCGIPRPEEKVFNLERSITPVNSPVNGSRYKANIQSFADLSKLSSANQVTEASSRNDDKV